MTDTSASLSQPLYGATLGQAINRFFKKYATFSGRASRSEYWWVVLALGIVNAVFSILFNVTGGSFTPDASGVIHVEGGTAVIALIWSLLNLAILIPSIAIAVRRLHDGNRSGWFYLLHLIPFVGSLIVFILMLLPSKPEGARFDK